ncbi:hypothetical protein BDZ89DRAFT_386780 [Hymenopellis radicata]|nr:hypothetical protein BDZ89DRAFT_386780 [Hymenopellis radicata]
MGSNGAVRDWMGGRRAGWCARSSSVSGGGCWMSLGCVSHLGGRRRLFVVAVSGVFQGGDGESSRPARFSGRHTEILIRVQVRAARTPGSTHGGNSTQRRHQSVMINEGS